MNVRQIITMNRGVKYNIDGKLYKNEMYIPEIIRDRKVDEKYRSGNLVTIYTRDEIKTLKQCNEELKNRHGHTLTLRVKSYIEDDGSKRYYYNSTKYEDSDAYETIEEAFEEANDYLNGIGELW